MLADDGAHGADPIRRLQAVSDPRDTRALPLQIRDRLLALLAASAEDRLPPEAALAERLGVSRTTVRAALAHLEADGLIERRRRLGTFVNRSLLRTSMRLNRLVPFTVLIEQQGHVASVDPQVHRVGAPSAEAAEAIGVTTATPCLIVERLLRAGGTPVIAVLDVVPVRRLKVRPEAVVEADTSFAFLLANGVEPVDYTVAEMVPRVAAGAHVPDALEIAPGEAYLELLETHFSRDHERLAVSRVAVDDRLVRLSLLRE